jgi:ATP-dependent RNA helicase DeaD
MENFSSFGLPENLVKALTSMGFVTPTPIQSQVIPNAIKGLDILGSAQTGTGKTGAFGIPVIAQLQNNTNTALIMTPTRELAVQVASMIDLFIGKSQENIKTALLIGGEDIRKQLRQLKSRPRIIIGTPGRINDHIRRSSLNLKNTKHLVLDETDRMLDMGFAPQIDAILEFVPQERQTLMFSATFPKNILNLAAKYLNDPIRVSIGESNAPAAKLTQEVIHISEGNKHEELLRQLRTREGSIIVFVKTKYGAERIAKQLRDESLSADVIHGDLKHAKRERNLEAFRKEKFTILVATDIAARGLDIAHVKHVINHDLPQCPEDYIHRIGRTARAGAEGAALCFVTPGERRKWKAISEILSKKFISEIKEHGDMSAGGGGERSRSSRGNGDRRSPSRSGDRNSRGNSSDRSYAPRGDRPARADGERSYAPRGDRPARADGERSYAPRGDRPARADGERSYAPRGDRPARPDGERRSYAPRDGERKSYAPRDGERKSYAPRDGERKSYAPRDGERKSYAPRDGDRRGNSDQRPARRDSRPSNRFSGA